jgi:predicted RNase H-like HicB family nuclease
MATSTLSMTISYEQGNDGWVIASVPEVPGTHSQGRTREEARANVLDALVVMLTPDDDLPAGDSEPLVLTIVQ